MSAPEKLHPMECYVDTKYGRKLVTGVWAVQARNGHLDQVVAEVEGAIERRKARSEASTPDPLQTGTDPL